ncbi:hypothetical protein K435DRAFT_760617 [Dendrothele bispora CBS 962.96]|uniref:F-box domain-containing protein n=1 Tax=Dendrothele bispora (strain CBS 962.96) TaxID=1314807 RepID=A0A4V4HE86_DENBC|nr:hypothetical protein K435DRAFT_760617 [Dendrothele bispora CBS 962.96]
MHLILELSDDVLVYFFSFMSIPEILCIRKTCRRLNDLSRLSIVWIGACQSQVISKGYPFPRCSLQDLTQRELERLARRAFHLAQRWLQPGGALCPCKETKFVVSPSAPVSDIRFIEGFEEKFLLTVSKGIWSVITIWDISPALDEVVIDNTPSDRSPRKCCEWSPKGGLFTGLTLNSDLHSDAKLAVSIAMESGHQIQLMDISFDGQLLPICSVDIAMKPKTLEGDLLAMSDDFAQTTIYNWKTGDYAVLKHLQDQEGVWKQDHCIQVVFAHDSILVVRARSIHLFQQPVLKPAKDDAVIYLPIARHSFGWIDGVSVVPPSSIHSSPLSESDKLPPPLTILVRSESDDPWTSDEHSLDLYTLMPSLDLSNCPSDEGNSSNSNSNPAQVTLENSSVTADTQIPALADVPLDATPAPYHFPPLLTARISSIRGTLRCTDVVLGPCRTAVWIRPHDRSLSGLMGGLQNGEQYELPSYLFEQTERSQEGLVCAVFPGPLCAKYVHPNPQEVSSRQSGLSTAQGAFNRAVDPGKKEGDVRMMWMNELNNWTTLDYYEAMGRIALGSGDGYVTLLEL